MNTYLSEAKEFYGALSDADDFERDLATYLQAGYVVSSPNSIIFGKPVRKDGGDPVTQWWDDESQCDAWFVKFACGDGMYSKFIEAMPFKLPYIGWVRERKNKPVRYWRCEQILRRK